MEGRRVHPDRQGQLKLNPGEYGKTVKGVWWVFPPRGAIRVVETETVTEHDDGTITVSRMISNQAWKGRLERGRWIEE